MTLAFCSARRQAELPAFLRVLKAIPPGKRDYRPDPKSRTAGELAALLAASEAALLSLLETGVAEWKDPVAAGRHDGGVGHRPFPYL